jgi:hypothetical protein
VEKRRRKKEKSFRKGKKRQTNKERSELPLLSFYIWYINGKNGNKKKWHICETTTRNPKPAKQAELWYHNDNVIIIQQ